MKTQTHERYEQIRMRSRELMRLGYKGDARFDELTEKFYLGKSTLIGILYSKRLKKKEKLDFLEKPTKNKKRC